MYDQYGFLYFILTRPEAHATVPLKLNFMMFAVVKSTEDKD
jgi:hypothetical protein